MQRNHDWYNRNEARSWPLDDAATLVDDGGRFLPSDILADLHLWFPDTIGQRAFVSAVTISPTLVTLVILSSATGTPTLATVSLIQPVVPYRQYPLESRALGAGGWVVFGSRVNDVRDVESYRFSNPAQTILLARAAQHYPPFPVTGVSKVNTRPKLTGIVNLSGGQDVETFKDNREIEPGVFKDVAVIRLVDKTPGTTDRNVQEIYTGPCGPRPESINCGNPQPIEFINEVPPDCCGQIYIEFRGCAELFEITNMNGVAIDCAFGMVDACFADDHLPDKRGRLPNEYDDLCELQEPPAPSVEALATASASFQEIVMLMQPDVEATAEGLPYTETFSAASAPGFTVDTGSFRFQPRDVLSGKGYGGTVFYMSFSREDQCYLKFGEEHGLHVDDRFVSAHVIDGQQVLMEHKVVDVENDVAVHSRTTLITHYETLPTSGVWIKLTGLGTGPDGGGMGTSDKVNPFEDVAWYDTDDPSLLTVGDKVVVLGNDVDHYNQPQTIVKIIGPDFGTDIAEGDPGGRSAWLVSVPRGGGAASVFWSGRGALRISSDDPHGLAAGDCIVFVPSTQAIYLRLFQVRRVLSITEFEVASDSYQPSDRGSWYLVRSGQSQDTVYESDPTMRAVSLWTHGAPREPNWTCLHKQIAVTLRFKAMGARYRLNGGIVFNYRRDKTGNSFGLLELDSDAGKLLRLWQVNNNNWTLWQHADIPDFQVDMPYRLTLDILPYSDKAADAFVTARLDGFEQESQYQLEPIRIPSFSPSTGLIGLHANRSRVQFNNFFVKHLE